MTTALEAAPGTVVTLAMKDGLNGQMTREDQPCGTATTST